jgi:hypothetical protein
VQLDRVGISAEDHDRAGPVVAEVGIRRELDAFVLAVANQGLDFLGRHQLAGQRPAPVPFGQ